jgi:crotonobetainyl-CoA:carnitine CoA-transferase CaiB-like acyl-CoA transferase
MGRTGPDSHAVAYGTLLQCYAGFAGLNRHPEVAPRIGLAWLDPMCALMLAFIAAAALWHRQQYGEVARVDFSMLEAMLWTMAEPLLDTVGAPPKPWATHRPSTYGGGWAMTSDQRGRRTDAEWRFARGARLVSPGIVDLTCVDADAIDAALSAGHRNRHRSQARRCAVRAFQRRSARSGDLVRNAHLVARDFWDNMARVSAGLAVARSFGRTIGPAPGLGADSEQCWRSPRLSHERIAALKAGVLG